MVFFSCEHPTKSRVINAGIMMRVCFNLTSAYAIFKGGQNYLKSKEL